MQYAKNLAVALFFLVIAHFSFAEISVGVYYFPGWSGDNSGGGWGRIKKYPERKPLIGWYDERSQAVADKHISWMVSHGIDFVVYDWYWEEGVKHDHAVNNFIKSDQGVKPYFAILWANHSNHPRNLEEFDEIVGFWIAKYFSSDFYLKDGQKPVVVIFSPENFERVAKRLGVTTKFLIERANGFAVDRGFLGIGFVAVAHAVSDYVNNVLISRGYSAITAYNYHFGLSGSYDDNNPPALSHSYQELISGYSQTWSWFEKNSRLPYWYPITSGWDKSPWGGSADPLHDNSFASPELFDVHLQEVKEKILKRGARNKSYVLICCWNEFGEGSYIEPSSKYGFSFLNSIKNIFRRD